MKYRRGRPGKGKARAGALASLALLSALAFSACGNGNITHVDDRANVLNDSRVMQAATRVPENVTVYTSNGFNGTQADFQRAMNTRVSDRPDQIVMGIDPSKHYVSIANGANVPFSNADVTRAANAFGANNGYADPTRGTVAALGTMDNTLRANDHPGGGILWSLLPMLLLSLLFGAFRSRRPSLAYGRTGMWGFGGPLPGGPGNIGGGGGRFGGEPGGGGGSFGPLGGGGRFGGEPGGGGGSFGPTGGGGHFGGRRDSGGGGFFG